MDRMPDVPAGNIVEMNIDGIVISLFLFQCFDKVRFSQYANSSSMVSARLFPLCPPMFCPVNTERMKL
eukprot:275319-Pelagomonas_calceolata.AAC.3